MGCGCEIDVGLAHRGDRGVVDGNLLGRGSSLLLSFFHSVVFVVVSAFYKRMDDMLGSRERKVLVCCLLGGSCCHCSVVGTFFPRIVLLLLHCRLFDGS